MYGEKRQTMKIRPMTIDDYKQVYALWLSVPGMGLNTQDDSEESISRFLTRNPNTSMVAEKDGLIIGAILSGHDGRRGCIRHLAVAKSQQRQGTGKALVYATLDALKKEGIPKVNLVAFANNNEGNTFWEKLGFTTRNDLVYRDKIIKD